MKYYAILIFFLSSLAVYGQDTDLIVTTTGDSLRCKIIDVTNSEVLFRFGIGEVISIKRNETASYEYNFSPVKKVEKVQKIQKNTEIQQKDDFLRHYVELLVGLPAADEGYIIGVDAAYLFNKYTGVGLALHHCNAKWLDDWDDGTYGSTFVGPFFLAKTKGKIYFSSQFGLGLLFTNYQDLKSSYNDYQEKTTAFFISLGGGFKLTDSLSLKLNLEVASDFEFEDGSAGLTVGLSYHF